ncbi:MAG: hypothetical protein WAU56_14080 [Steroidobacteraceae bacterium]
MPAIVALLAQAGMRGRTVEPHNLHWKYWQPRADWAGPRSFVLANGSSIVAHGGVIPGSCAWESRRIRTLHVIDWVASPREIGAGVTLMNYIGQRAEALLAIGGGPQTVRILPNIGFRATGTAIGYARPLSPLRLLQGGGHRDWRLLPRFARSLAWKLAAPPAVPGKDWLARRVAGDDLERISAVLPIPARGMGVCERSADLFSYSLACPIVPMQLYSVERGGRVHGYFLLAPAPGQVRIADCWMDSDRPGDWRAMINCAVTQAGREPEAAETVIWASDPLLSETLRASGFHARQKTPILLRSANGAAVPAAPLRVQMLDNDAAYMHEGRSELWV